MSLTEPLLPPQPQPQPQPQHQPRSMVNSMIGVICLWVWIGGVCMTYVFYFTLPNSIYLGYTQILFLFGWIMISATFSYAYMFFFLFRFTSIGVGTPLLLLLFGITSYIWSTSFSFLSLLLLIPLLILLLHRLSTLPLLFTNLKNQQNLLHLTKELSLHDIPLLFVLAPLGVVLGLIGSVPFGWVLWNLGAVHPVLGFGIGVVWVWSWGVLRGLLTVISAWVVGRWYNNNNNTKLLLPCLHASLPTITLSSLILSAIHILTFLINLLSLFSSFSSWFSLWSWFWFWFSPWSRFRSWTHLLVWCLHRITARFNPYTLVYIGFTGAHPNHSLSIPNRPINKVSSPLPLPLAFILAFALITYSSPYPSPQPTLFFPPPP
ncbi:hypothetical protein GGU11DRAFT_799554 [Lentinula aff. detonsa]|nr:hypothetical protein GGU11DRAFT_799554 [Lentinula aff. detonsa]